MHICFNSECILSRSNSGCIHAVVVVSVYLVEVVVGVCVVLVVNVYLTEVVVGVYM